MQPELFQNFINSIPSLNSEQWTILNRTLLNARIPTDDAVENSAPDLVNSKLSSNNQSVTPDLEVSILSRFSEHPLCPKCKGHSIYR